MENRSKLRLKRPNVQVSYDGRVYEQTYNRNGKPAGIRRRHLTPQQLALVQAKLEERK